MESVCFTHGVKVVGSLMAPQQRAQLGGVSPQSCRRASFVVCDTWGEEMKRSMLLLSALTLPLHVALHVFLSNQLS